MYIGLRVKYPVFLTDFNDIWIFWIYFRQSSNIRINENLFSDSWVDTSGQTDWHDEVNSPFSKFFERA